MTNQATNSYTIHFGDPNYIHQKNNVYHIDPNYYNRTITTTGTNLDFMDNTYSSFDPLDYKLHTYLTRRLQHHSAVKKGKFPYSRTPKLHQVKLLHPDAQILFELTNITSQDSIKKIHVFDVPPIAVTSPIGLTKSLDQLFFDEDDIFVELGLFLNLCCNSVFGLYAAFCFTLGSHIPEVQDLFESSMFALINRQVLYLASRYTFTHSGLFPSDHNRGMINQVFYQMVENLETCLLTQGDKFDKTNAVRHIEILLDEPDNDVYEIYSAKMQNILEHSQGVVAETEQDSLAIAEQVYRTTIRDLHG